jgi:hypothetical protein
MPVAREKHGQSESVLFLLVPAFVSLSQTAAHSVDVHVIDVNLSRRRVAI